MKKVQEVKSVQQPVALIHLSVRLFGNRTRASQDEVSTNIPEDYQFKHARRLFAKDVLKDIEKVRNAARTFTYAKSVPYPVRGLTATTFNMLPEVIETLDSMSEEFYATVDSFLMRYEGALERARTELGPRAFKSKRYPTVHAMRDRFSFEYKILEAPSPASGLKEISKDLYNKEVEKIERMMEEAGQEMVQALCDRFMEFFNRCVDKMTKEKKRFKRTAFENFELFLDDIPKLSTVTTDLQLQKQLNDLASKTKGMVQNLDLDGLKDDEKYRVAMRKDFKKIEKAANTLMENVPKRSIKVMKK